MGKKLWLVSLLLLITHAHPLHDHTPSQSWWVNNLWFCTKKDHLQKTQCSVCSTTLKYTPYASCCNLFHLTIIIAASVAEKHQFEVRRYADSNFEKIVISRMYVRTHLK